MNWSVYGQVLANIPAPELVEGGYILPPKVVVKQLPVIKGRKVMYAEDADNLLETIDDNNIDKTLICARTTKQIMGLTLNTWGKDSNKKFVVIHHSILSEGINVSGLEAVIFMRNMDYIGISQSIGRVIRLGDCHKTFGLVCIPTYDSVGISTARKVQAVVDTVFHKGQPAISEIRR
jgi:predicted helicase